MRGSPPPAAFSKYATQLLRVGARRNRLPAVPSDTGISSSRAASSGPGTGRRPVRCHRRRHLPNRRAPRMGTRLVEAVLTALDEQTVTVPGTTAAETVLPRLADSLRQVLQQRDQVAAEV